MSQAAQYSSDLSLDEKRALLQRMLREKARKPQYFPLSFAQQRLWFLDRLDPGSPAYNLSTPLRMEGALDLLALERSLSAIVRRHAILRTTFTTQRGQPAQAVAPSGGPGPILRLVDLQALPEERRQGAGMRLAEAESQRPFDLERGPLLRTTLLRIGAREHIFLLTMHHIISDGWSLNVFMRELFGAYRPFGVGAAADPPEPPIQYADYAVWQRDWLRGPVLEEQLAYWKAQLADLPTIDLAIERRARPEPAAQSRNLPFTVPEATSAALAALARREGCTLFMALLAAWQVLLARYSRQDDVVVGSPISGRARVETEDLIGCFVNMLVLRAGLTGDPPFREALRRVREVCLEAYARQDIPFEQLVEELESARDMGRHPLFQITFALQHGGDADPDIPGLRVSPLPSEAGAAKFDLTLTFAEDRDGLSGVLGYDAGLFDASRIAAMARHLQTLLQAIAADPAQPIGALPLLAEAERRQIAGWNATQRAYPRAAGVHALFEAQAARSPDAVAAIFADGGADRDGAARSEHLTYAELNARANRLAHHLRALGVGPGVRVALRVERSVELLVGMLGVFKSGGAYVPLDPSHPDDRTRFMLEDSRARVLVTNDERRTTNAGAPSSVPGPSSFVNLRDDWPIIGRMPASSPDVAVAPGHLAYLIYTSGSTGRPKAVQVEQRSLVNVLCASREAFALGPDLAMPALASIAFDIALFELLNPLLVGGAAVVLSTRQILDPALLLAQLARCTALHAVPSLMRQIVQALRAGSGPQAYDHIRSVFVGGELVPPDLLDDLRAAFRRAAIHVLYGPTEGAIICASYAAPRDRPIGRHVVGAPLGNMQTWILDRSGGLAPVGVAGEIHIGGAGVARGYLGRPDLTAARFIPNPFAQGSGVSGQASDPDPRSPIPDPRLYRTGDLARYRDDGQIEFLGRIDAQVKIRGYRIEPGEVAAALRAHPAVRDAAVVAREDAPGDMRLIAYIVPRQGSEVRGQGSGGASGDNLIPDPRSPIPGLREWLGARLPAYMVPAAFVELDALPLNAHGKLDRRALPDPDPARAPDQDFAPPRTPAEELLADIWADLLRLDRVGVHDNFFMLGGHSLLATQVISRIREVFHAEIPLRRLFENPTVARLAAQIEAARRDAPGPPDPPRPVPRDGPLPLSFAQQRLWFLDQMDPGGAAYNIPLALRLGGALQIAALRGSLGAIVARHESLRTTFALVDGQPAQIIAPPRPARLPLIDLRGLAEPAREAAALGVAEREARIPFDLARGPLLRIALIRLSDASHLLLLTLHHIISDGWSQDVLVRELVALYAARVEGRSADLPNLPIQYADYAVWQRAWLQGSVRDAQLAYWKAQLAGLDPLDLPTDHARPPEPSFRGASARFEFPAALRESLAALARSAECTLFIALLAAWQALLARYSSQADIAVGTPIANRARGETEGLIGFFVNTLVLRAQLPGRITFRAALDRVREACLDAYTHQDIPFEQVVDAVQPARDLSRHPLFQVMFLLQSGASAEPDLPGLTIEPAAVETATTKFDLTLSMVEGPDGMIGALAYSVDLFEHATIERMIGHLQTLLAGIAERPDQRLADLPLLRAAERREILADRNATARDYSAQPVHERFAAQAARTPDAVAAACASAHLTYGALDAQTAWLAHELRRAGARAESRVGVCLERTPELMIAILGALKAGSAYVPLDPSYPGERLAFMLADAGCVAVVTQARLRDRLPPCDAQTILLDGDQVRRAGPPPDRDPRVAPDNLAYVIYTSGSTGSPKGAMITHRGLANYLSWCLDAYDVAAGAGAPVHSSITFDLTVTSLFAPLLAGRTVRLLPDADDITALGAALRDGPDFSFVKLTPAHLDLLRQQLGPDEIAGRAHTLIVGGENLLAERLAFWRSAAPATQIINEYGPTEAVVGCCVYRVPSDISRAGAVPIGRPIANTQLYILDAQLQPTPDGAPGELYIGGAQLARGYLGRPDLTADRFLPNPFAQGSGVRDQGSDPEPRPLIPDPRLYRTGDLARYRPGGVIEFLGRRDDQVKIRGYRIEPGEVAAALGAHPAVRECTVVARAGRLIAYVVTSDEFGGTSSPAEDRSLKSEDSAVGAAAPLSSSFNLLSSQLRAFLAQTLPAHMIPAAFVPLDALPLTPNGKLDRRALPAPESARNEQDGAFAAPRTPVEQALAGIWADVLRVERVGLDDNFFALGGDSILSIQIVARAAQAGIRITPKQLFQHQTIAELAGVAETAAAPTAEQGAVEGSAPLTPIQRWFFERDLADAHHYNQSLLLEIRRPINHARLAQAINALIAHHDALRLRFTIGEGGWIQHHAGVARRALLKVIDLSSIPDAIRADALDAAGAAIQAGLDPSNGPILRAAAFALGPGRTSRLLIAVHHLAIDGVSWGVLLEDLQAAYAQLSAGKAADLPPKTTSFKRWAERLAEYANTPALRDELRYWTDPARRDFAPLPQDYPGGSNTIETAREVGIALDEDETDALLRAVPRAYQTQINDALLTALAQAYAQWTGSAALLVDLEGHGREDLFADVDLTRTVGWFTALFPALLRVRRGADPGEALRSVKEQLRAIPRHGIGYGILRYLSPAGEQLRALPPAQVSFNYLGQVDQTTPGGGLLAPTPEPGGPAQSPRGRRSHLIEINGMVAGGRLRMVWTYSEAVHARATIEWLAQAYLAALRALIAHCQEPATGGRTPSDFPLAQLDQDALDTLSALIDAMDEEELQ